MNTDNIISWISAVVSLVIIFFLYKRYGLIAIFLCPFIWIFMGLLMIQTYNNIAAGKNWRNW